MFNCSNRQLIREFFKYTFIVRAQSLFVQIDFICPGRLQLFD